MLCACAGIKLPEQKNELTYDVGFRDEGFVKGGILGESANVFGAQNPQIYRTYREGELELSTPIKNGDYEISLFFIEPKFDELGKRNFDVFANDVKIISNLDIIKAAGGVKNFAVSRTIGEIKVSNGELKIRLSGKNPILSGLSIKPKPTNSVSKNLVWSDEFAKVGAPNSKIWGFEEWAAYKVNNESQSYTGSIENAFLKDGYLHIKALNNGGKFTSARLYSKPEFAIEYGRVEVRAKLPNGGGTWPAIWFLPLNPYKYATVCQSPTEWQGNDKCDAWPNSGEIDLMEHIGNEMGVVHGTVHSKAYYWLNNQQRKGSVVLNDGGQGFHTYALEWRENRIEMSIDGIVYFTYEKEKDADWQTWPFDQKFQLILNLAIGGNWGNAFGGTDMNAFPQEFLIDYVRVYNLSE